MEDYTIRKAVFEDLEGICEVLSEEFTTTVPATRYWWSIMENSSIHTYVIEYKNEIIGTASLHVLKKLTHSGSHVGLIEDVCVLKKYSGKGLGRGLIDTLVDIAKDEKCYKVILNCSEENVGFYKKCGFEQKEVQMRLDIKE